MNFNVHGIFYVYKDKNRLHNGILKKNKDGEWKIIKSDTLTVEYTQ